MIAGLRLGTDLGIEYGTFLVEVGLAQLAQQHLYTVQIRLL